MWRKLGVILKQKEARDSLRGCFLLCLRVDLIEVLDDRRDLTFTTPFAAVQMSLFSGGLELR